MNKLTEWLKEYDRRFSPITPREMTRKEFIKEMIEKDYAAKGESRSKLLCPMCGQRYDGMKNTMTLSSKGKQK